MEKTNAIEVLEDMKENYLSMSEDVPEVIDALDLALEALEDNYIYPAEVYILIGVDRISGIFRIIKVFYDEDNALLFQNSIQDEKEYRYTELILRNGSCEK